MKKKKDNKFKFNSEQLKSIQDIEDMSKKAIDELQKICKEMIGIANDVKEEYGDLDIEALNEMSSSITQINENSPFLDEIFKGDSWKKVIKTNPSVNFKNKKQENEEKEND